MALSTQRTSIPLAVSVERIAQLVQTFSLQQKALLLQLVPDLRTIQPEEAIISPAQRELSEYFRIKMERFTDLQMQDSQQPDATEPFIDGYTINEFFALPDIEQSRIWSDAHQVAQRDLAGYERPVSPHALPAR